MLVILSFLLGGAILLGDIYRSNQDFKEWSKYREVNLSMNIDIGALASKNDSGLSFYSRVTHIDNKELPQELYIIAKFDSNIAPDVGESIIAQGKIHTPKGDQGFRYHEFLASKKIYGILSLESYQTLKHSTSIESANIRTKIYEKLRTLYPRDHADLLAAMIFGDTSHIKESYKELYSEVGLSHILVVSGSNITIVLLLLGSLLRVLPRGIRMPCIVLGVGLFAWVVGGGVPVIRAATLGIIGYLATQQKKKSDILLILGGIAVIFGVAMPYEILMDASFLLSFSATLGMILLVPHLQKILTFLPNSYLSLRDTVATSIAAGVSTLPILILQFGTFSLISLPVNILVLPMVGGITIGGIVSLLSSYLDQHVALIFAWWTDIGMRYLLSIAGIASDMTNGVMEVQIHQVIAIIFSIIFLIGWYGLGITTIKKRSA